MSEMIERIEVPEVTTRENLAWHLARYEFAATLIENGDAVLDAGCGVGYGARTLADRGAVLHGIDIEPAAIRAAMERGAPGDFRVGDLHELPYADGTFKGVVSFEVIEHLAHPERFLDEVVRVLAEGGWCVLSTPNPRYEVDNQFHERELHLEELVSMVEPRFASVDVLGQPWAESMKPAGTGSRLRELDRYRLRRVLPAGLRHGLRRLARADGTSVTAADLARAAVQPLAPEDANPHVLVCWR